MLAKHEDLFTFLVEDNLSRKVSILMMRRKLRKLLHIIDRALRLVSFTILIFNALIFIKHSTKHVISGFGVGHSSMRALQFRMTEISVSAFQVAWFHLHINVHHIDEVATLEIEVVVYTKEFLHQHWEVELQDIITRQVGITDKQGNFLSLIAKGGFVGHHLISITMHRSGFS